MDYICTFEYSQSTFAKGYLILVLVGVKYVQPESYGIKAEIYS